MNCYLCNSTIPDEEPFYNDYEKTVCKPCFSEAPRCFVCRFPGKQMEDVEGLGNECEFCRGKLVAEGMDPGAALDPLRPFLRPFGLRGDARPDFAWTDRIVLRTLQTDEDLPPDEFIDDFLRYCYPVFYNDGQLHLLRRMTKSTLVVYGLIQLAAAEIATEYGQPSLAGSSEWGALARGWCHWVGSQAAQRMGYDLELRQLRKWPELGGQGDFERWVAMSKFNKTPKMVNFFRVNLRAFARKDDISAPEDTGDAP